jgi:TonB family protein
MIVGEGKGITRAVMAVVFTLFLLLTVTIVMGIEEYGPKLWALFGAAPSEPARVVADRKAASTANRVIPNEPRLPDASTAGSGLLRMENPTKRVRPVPPPDRALAGRRPIFETSPASWFGSDAYPDEAIRQGQQGRVVAKLSLDPAGLPTACTVLSSSRSISLDRTTCSQFLKHATFKPARDRKGVATVGEYTVPVRWVLPEN